MTNLIATTVKRPSAARPRNTRCSVVRWWTGWELLAVLPTAVIQWTPASWPRWALMWLLAIAVYAGFKWLTWRRTPAPDAPAWKHLGYLLAWPGMDAAAFLRRDSKFAPPTTAEGIVAAGKTFIGVLVLWVIARLIPAEYSYCRGWAGMAGIVLVLHFGLIHVLSCAWRSIGVNARPLMDWPIAATSVSDFWGRRWNTAFRDLTHRFFFRPLTPRLGARGAILVGFVFSGLVHDFVMSPAAHGGYGGPTLFFLISGAAMFAERSPLGRHLGLGRGWRGWLFAVITILVPAPLLFHPPFVERIVVPFLQAIEAL
jgi:alginate O-acetyltransferase complex protein AlgI